MPVRKGRASFDPFANLLHVGHCSHMKDPGQIDAWQWRMHRRRSGRQHQFVVGLGRDFAGRDVAQVHGLLFGRDGDRFAVRPASIAKCRAEELLAGNHQARFLRNHAADVVRKPAVRVRNVRPAFHHDDFGFFIQTCAGALHTMLHPPLRQR